MLIKRPSESTISLSDGHSHAFTSIMKTLKKFFYLARPFWSGAHGRLQWLMLAVLIGFTLFSITISVWIAAWDKRFYDALAAFDGLRDRKSVVRERV